MLLACATRVESVDDDTSGAPESGGDIEPDGVYIDCAQIGDNEPTVAPGAPGPLGFPEYACNPRTSGSGNGYQCCSSDPATADGQLPAYAGKGIVGSPPLYADAANDSGAWGMCVRVTDIPEGAGLLAPAAMNCPIACDPTWADGEVATVCGSGRVCCQTFALGAADCVQDNATGSWRPVTGADIGSNEIMPLTNWNNAAHDTHQDPNGTVCLGASGGANTSEFIECIQHLSVADRRGYCMALAPGAACPGAAPGYIDACEAMN